MSDKVVDINSARRQFMQFGFSSECMENGCDMPFRIRVVCEKMEDGVHLSYENVLELLQEISTALIEHQKYIEDKKC